jgi:hypothetical protein
MGRERSCCCPRFARGSGQAVRVADCDGDVVFPPTLTLPLPGGGNLAPSPSQGVGWGEGEAEAR